MAKPVTDLLQVQARGPATVHYRRAYFRVRSGSSPICPRSRGEGASRGEGRLRADENQQPTLGRREERRVQIRGHQRSNLIFAVHVAGIGTINVAFASSLLRFILAGAYCRGGSVWIVGGCFELMSRLMAARIARDFTIWWR